MRELENNIESEKIILGSIMSKNDLIMKSISYLKQEDFYRTSHQYIYESMLNLFKNNIKFDVTILANSLNKYIKANAITISELADIGSYDFNSTIEEHIKLVKKSSNIRKLKKSCMDIMQLDNPKKIIEQLQSVVDDVVNDSNSENDKLISLEELVFYTMEKVEETMRNGGKPRGISTGFNRLNNATNGLVPGDYWIVGARPSVGKTAFLIQLLSNIAKGSKSLFVQMDMSKEAIGQRFLSNNAVVGNGKLGRGKLNDHELDRVLKSCSELSKKNNMFVYLKDNITIIDIKNKAKEMKIKHGLDLIVLDHIGLIKPLKKGFSAENEMREISKQLKVLARELNVTVIALSQLSRGVESRVNKRPMLSDLRESGSLEQDADIVGFLYRDGYVKAREDGTDIPVDVIEFSIQKNRNGKIGTIKYDFELDIQSFKERLIND